MLGGLFPAAAEAEAGQRQSKQAEGAGLGDDRCWRGTACKSGDLSWCQPYVVDGDVIVEACNIFAELARSADFHFTIEGGGGDGEICANAGSVDEHLKAGGVSGVDDVVPSVVSEAGVGYAAAIPVANACQIHLVPCAAAGCASADDGVCPSVTSVGASNVDP